MNMFKMAKLLTPQHAIDNVNIQTIETTPSIWTAITNPPIIHNSLRDQYVSYVNHNLLDMLRSGIRTQCFQIGDYLSGMVEQVIQPHINVSYDRREIHLCNTIDCLGGHMEVRYFNFDKINNNTLYVRITNPIGPRMDVLVKPLIVNLTLNDVVF